MHSVQIGSMSNCKTLKICPINANCVDLCNVLAEVATVNTVKKLMIDLYYHLRQTRAEDYQLELLEKALPKFTNLHTINISIFSAIGDHSKFVLTLFKCLPNLNKCILNIRCYFDLMNEIKIVEFSKQLTVLEIRGQAAHVNKSWYKRLLKIKLDRNDSFCLERTCEKLKWNFQAYQENIIKLSVLDRDRHDPF